MTEAIMYIQLSITQQWRNSEWSTKQIEDRLELLRMHHEFRTWVNHTNLIAIETSATMVVVIVPVTKKVTITVLLDWLTSATTYIYCLAVWVVNACSITLLALCSFTWSVLLASSFILYQPCLLVNGTIFVIGSFRAQSLKNCKDPL